MTDYTKQVEALRWNGTDYKGSTMDEEDKQMYLDAAAAIEELENALADECKECDYLVNENARLTTENNELRDNAKQAAAAIEALQAEAEKWTFKATLEQSKAIANFESYCKLKAQLPKRGEWIYEDLDNFRKYKVTCPHCGAWYVGNYDAYDEPSEFLYCPHCGNICNPANLDWENELKEREKEARERSKGEREVQE